MRREMRVADLHAHGGGPVRRPHLGAGTPGAALTGGGSSDSIREKDWEKVKKTVQKITGEEVEVEFD